MATRVDYFFSFRSPYSYLSGPRAFALPERYDIELVFRGVIPMAMRGIPVPREKGLHTLRDVKREAVRLGMPFGRVHDPIGDMPQPVAGDVDDPPASMTQPGIKPEDPHFPLYPPPF